MEVKRVKSEHSEVNVGDIEKGNKSEIGCIQK